MYKPVTAIVDLYNEWINVLFTHTITWRIRWHAVPVGGGLDSRWCH